MAFVKISEQPSLYDDLEKKSVHDLLVDINREDQKVALAVEQAIPQIEKLVTLLVPRMKKGGRIFYMGAGTSGRLGVLDASEIPPTFGVPPTHIIGLIAGRNCWNTTSTSTTPLSVSPLRAQRPMSSVRCARHGPTASSPVASPATPIVPWQPKPTYPSR